MKHTQISLLIISAVSLVSCSSPNSGTVAGINKAVPGTSSNPLNPAGTSSKPKKKAKPDFAPGVFLATQSANTPLFKRYPSRSDQPIKTIATNTEVKVISSQPSYTKVEIVKTGEVGYLPTVKLGKKRYAKKAVSKKPKKVTKPAAKKKYTAPTVTKVAVPDVVVPEVVVPSLPTPAIKMEPIVPAPSSFSVVEDLPSVAPAPVKSLVPDMINPLLPAE